MAPSLTPSSLSPSFAAGVTRRRFCDRSGIEQRGRQRWPHLGMQRSALRCVRDRACAGLASRGVVGRAQPRTSSIAQLSERLRARHKVRVEVPKLHQYVWAGQRHPVTLAAGQAARDAERSPREATAPAAGGRPLPDQPGRVQVLPAQAVAVAAWAEVVEPAAPVDAIDRAQPRALPSQLRADQVAARQWLQFGVQGAGRCRG